MESWRWLELESWLAVVLAVVALVVLTVVVLAAVGLVVTGSWSPGVLAGVGVEVVVRAEVLAAALLEVLAVES